MRFSHVGPAGEQDLCDACADADGVASCLPENGVGLTPLDLAETSYKASFDGTNDLLASSDAGALVRSAPIHVVAATFSRPRTTGRVSSVRAYREAMVLRNVGEIDSNVRKFLALPFAVLAVTGALAYHAYPFALAMVGLGAMCLATGTTRFSPLWWILGVDTNGGVHRVARS